MNKERFKKMYEKNLAGQNEINDNVINKIQSKSDNKRFHFALKPVIAACLAIVMLIGCFSGYATIPEAKEYRAAISFFEENDLPTEGLSRAEIKGVYKDITLKTFSFKKTLETLNTFSVELFSVELGTRNREELENLWNYRKLILRDRSSHKNGLYYKISDSDEKTTDGLPMKSIINKYDGDKLLWSRTIDYWVFSPEANFIEVSEGTVLHATASGNSPSFGVVMMFDKAGNVLWEKRATELHSHFTAGILDDNQVAIFGHRFQDIANNRQWYFIYKKYDLQGNLVQKNEEKLESYQRVSTAALADDHYLVKCFNHKNSGQLISVSKQGNFIDKIFYSQNGKEYLIQDIYTYSGKVYLSAMLHNMDTDTFNKEFENLRREYYNAWGNNRVMPESYNKRLCDLFIEQFTAVLLVCDEKGAVETAYSAPNARGGLFSISAGNLLQWQVIRLDDVKNAPPNISSRSVEIVATDFRFVFDMSGKMVTKTETGLIPLMH